MENKINRTQALMAALGWQGGTIHQVSEETGCDVQALLYGMPESQHLNSDNCQGWFAARTNDVQFNKVNVFPKMRGNVDFWLGVARGMQLKMEGV